MAVPAGAVRGCFRGRRGAPPGARAAIRCGEQGNSGEEERTFFDNHHPDHTRPIIRIPICTVDEVVELPSVSFASIMVRAQTKRLLQKLISLLVYMSFM